MHVTQDVLKHAFHPEKVFKEIARTLKPGGIHIFLCLSFEQSRPGAKMNDDVIQYLNLNLITIIPSRTKNPWPRPTGNMTFIITFTTVRDCSHR